MKPFHNTKRKQNMYKPNDQELQVYLFAVDLLKKEKSNIDQITTFGVPTYSLQTTHNCSPLNISFYCLEGDEYNLYVNGVRIYLEQEHYEHIFNIVRDASLLTPKEINDVEVDELFNELFEND